jgi:murein DD-endopeptidase MepM/ murein hydrolase activator NlpD
MYQAPARETMEFFLARRLRWVAPGGSSMRTVMLTASVILSGCAPVGGADEVAGGDGIESRADALGGSCAAVPDWFNDSEDLFYPEDPGHHFQAPKTAFNGDLNAAMTFLLGVRARIQTALPFGSDHPYVVRAGWHYDTGKSHRGIDWSRDDTESGKDPTFAVRAMADGVVKAVIPFGVDSPNGGNTVILEHTGTDGSKMLTLYMHLRNGRTHDLGVAQSALIAAKCLKYSTWAFNNPTDYTWGTDSQTIAVATGDTVKRGQFIAWAGNTGCGGIGNGLNSDGTAIDSNVNTHLHVYTTIEVPGATVTNPDGSTAQVAVQVDPYGMYTQADSGCYEGLRGSLYHRVIQPFPPDFHHVPYDDFNYFASYFPTVGYAPQTLGLSRDGGDLYASGSYQPGLSPSWKMLYNYKADDFNSKLSDYAAAGYRPRQTQVHIASDGLPRFTAIFMSTAVAYDYSPQLLDSQIQGKETQLVDNGTFHVEDLFPYAYAGLAWGASLFVDGGSSLVVRDLSDGTLPAIISAEAPAGWRPVNLSVKDYGSYLSTVIFKKSTGCWQAAQGMTFSGYQSWYSTMTQKGYRLVKLQSYADASRYAAVFTRSMPISNICP